MSCVVKSLFVFVTFHLKARRFCHCCGILCPVSGLLARDLSPSSRVSAPSNASPFPNIPVFYAPSLSPGQVHQSPSALSAGAAALVGGCHRAVTGRELASFLSCELVFITPQFPLAFGMGVSSGLMTEALRAVLLSSLSDLQVPPWPVYFPHFPVTVQVTNNPNPVSPQSWLCKSQITALSHFWCPKSPAAHQEHKHSSVSPAVHCRCVERCERGC